MPNRLSTATIIAFAKLRRSAVVPPRFSSATGWRLDTPAPPNQNPLANPACSTNHAAGTLMPSAAGYLGIGSVRADALQRASSAANPLEDRMG